MDSHDPRIFSIYIKSIAKNFRLYASFGIILPFIIPTGIGFNMQAFENWLPILDWLDKNSADPLLWRTWHILMWIGAAAILFLTIYKYPYSTAKHIAERIKDFQKYLIIVACNLLTAVVFYYITINPKLVPHPNIAMGHGQAIISIGLSSRMGLSIFGTLTMCMTLITWIALIVVTIPFFARLRLIFTRSDS